ncbi:MAG: TerC family protein [Pseudomonadota bacterium]|jgi:YjbE family integral membrane protein
MIDLGWLGWISWDAHFFSGLAMIMLINIILSGDNAVLIALAVRGLSGRQRIAGIVLGSLLAVVLRIILTAFAVALLQFAFLKLAGGALIAWIAVKLFTEGHDEGEVKESAGIWTAVRVIVIADLIMSIDNVLAIAGAASGNMFLIIFGLGTSIPLVVGTSALLTVLMDRYPIIVTIGAGVLGKVAGEMIITDPWVHQHLHPTRAEEIAVQVLFVIGVIVTGKLLLKWKESHDYSSKDAGNLEPHSSEHGPSA